MKALLILASIMISVVCVSECFAGYVQGYWRENGTYVQGYERTQADGNPYNNYSTRGY